ncbi:SPOR domain-containing protein [Comamonadaceae bacterium G21597-S1]|nr:SPOR domain-containing protein [Comamonadaceae bacterium G21597-S1]
MLRLLVLLLVLLNAAYYAWSHDMLRAYGFGPVRQAEPQRLNQQIRPEALIIVSTGAPRPAEAQARALPPEATASCLQAGLFDDSQATALRQAAQAVLPAGSWSLNEVLVPPRWIVYMGKYADAPALARKRAELAALNVRADAVSSPALEPGLSLGTFESEERAATELAALVKRGVRTAQVVQEAAESRASMLRITPVDDAVRSRLDELQPVLAGRSLRPCP